MTESTLRRAQAASLLERAGLRNDRFDMAPCSKSGNNRVHKRSVEDRCVVAKWYVKDPHDPRDRRAAEWAFLRCAADAGIEPVPRPCAVLHGEGVALYSFVEGDKLTRQQVTSDHVAQAARFLRALNGKRMRRSAETLAGASEACFSLADHLALLEDRIARLAAIAQGTPLDKEATELIAELGATWHRVRRRIVTGAERMALGLKTVLQPADRCLSPSDFGYHNALVGADGSVTCIDFEYAGWDDPAKLIADFFLQPAVPVDPVHRETIRTAVFARMDEDGRAQHGRRADLLQPLFALKWCCIMLNPFLPAWMARRGSNLSSAAIEGIKSDRVKATTRSLEAICRDHETVAG